ncbi:hypothetical protein F5972_34955 [Microbispora cellulosiformans]|uniref:Uncharacterized protein n=1 Tax=Microbispora cellulosiformans TaxID=2614688 RepID=A0A5J5JRE0_9ACTN|nr:hypothetical protein [Microbispora cellulosiformans]KAA9373606.1 hypothetical protein F5972_34955 [Microbispora cellulosiformans]
MRRRRTAIRRAVQARAEASPRHRWTWILPVALVVIALAACDPQEDEGAAPAATTGASTGAAAGGGKGLKGGTGSGGGGGNGRKTGHFTLTSGPTLDGDFSGPQGTGGGGSVCVTLSSPVPGEVRVVRVRLAQDGPGEMVAVPSGYPCTFDGPAASCEGTVLTPGGSVCRFGLDGEGDADSRARLVLTLERTCVDHEAPVCDGISASPSPAHPAVVTWKYTFTYYYCPNPAVGFPGIHTIPCPPPSGQPGQLASTTPTLTGEPTEPAPTDQAPTDEPAQG